MTAILKPSEIHHGAEIIKRGGVVAFPTETVYGLGADATNTKAIQKIFEAKGRPAKNPLIVHFESLQDLFARIPEIDPQTKDVLTKIQDALTVIIPRPKWIPVAVSAGLDTVAVRVPSCEFAREFIKACETPLAAPSANISGRPSPTRWQHVYVDLKGKIDAVFECDPTKIGVESTVIKVLSDKIQILRLGGVSTTELSKFMPIEIICGDQAKASPGTHFKHYAPTCKMVVAKYGEDMTQRIHNYIKGLTENEQLLGAGVTPAKKATVMFWQGRASDYLPLSRAERGDFMEIAAAQRLAQQHVVFLGNTPQEITQNLYSAIRAAEWGSDIIVCEGFPETAEYETLNERVVRAAEGMII